jgi:bacteriorhodopsin
MDANSFDKRNNALNVNEPVGAQPDLSITTHGSDWYFAVCAVMSVSTLAVMAWALTKPRRERLFHYISAGLLFVAAIAYFSMGSNLGQTPIQAEFVRRGSSQVSGAGTREIFYVRYIDWFVTTPLLLMDLLLTAGLPWPTILIAILADWIMIVCGLVGALVQTRYKWGYFVFGCVAFFYVAYALVWDGRQHANALGGSIKRTYNTCGVLLIFIWFLYPIAWGVSEGGNVIHPDSEAIFYGVLDIIAKPVFTFLLLWGHRNIDPAALGLNIREPGAAVGGAAEKQRHVGNHGHVGGDAASYSTGVDGRNGHHANGANNGTV